MSKIEELTKWFEKYDVIIPDGSKATIKGFMCGCEIETMAEELYEDFIADLQHRLDVAEKAFDNLYDKFKVVACEYAKMDTIPSKLHFKEQAESELKG